MSTEVVNLRESCRAIYQNLTRNSSRFAWHDLCGKILVRSINPPVPVFDFDLHQTYLCRKLFGPYLSQASLTGGDHHDDLSQVRQRTTRRFFSVPEVPLHFSEHAAECCPDWRGSSFLPDFCFIRTIGPRVPGRCRQRSTSWNCIVVAVDTRRATAS
jgi:hypothetical protein